MVVSDRIKIVAVSFPVPSTIPALNNIEDLIANNLIVSADGNQVVPVNKNDVSKPPDNKNLVSEKMVAALEKNILVSTVEETKNSVSVFNRAVKIFLVIDSRNDIKKN